MKPANFDLTLAVGRAAEQSVKMALQNKGWLIIPTADIVRTDGKGPRAESQDGEVILPDFDVVTETGRFWAEAKYKQDANFTILTHQWEHGIGLRSWRHYLTINERTRSPVWLFIIEGKRGLLLSQDITVLGPKARLYHGTKMDPGGMIFFDRELFITSTDVPFPPEPPIPDSPQPASVHVGRPRLQGQLWKE